MGIVREVGSAVHGLKPGSRVGVGWIRDSCRRCMACLRGTENLCASGYTGLIVGGTRRHACWEVSLETQSALLKYKQYYLYISKLKKYTGRICR